MLEYVLNNLCEDLVVSLVTLISSTEGISTKRHQFIDNFHDIFRIISIFLVSDVDIIIPEKLELIALPIIYF